MNEWFSQRPDVLWLHPEIKLKHFVLRPFLALHWAGLVVLPLFPLARLRGYWRPAIVGFAMMLLAAAFFHWRGQPFSVSHLFPYSAGMITYYGTYSDGLVVGERQILLTPLIRAAITVFGCAGTALIFATVWSMVRDRRWPGILLSFTILQFGMLLTMPDIMDRYLEVLFPGAILLAAQRCSFSGKRRFAGIAATALCGFVAIAIVHDWISWNTVRWELGREAVAKENIQPEAIEGGFEWNGWFANNNPLHPSVPNYHAVLTNDPASLVLRFSRYYFPKVTGQFALAFTQPPNSVVVTNRAYATWLPPGSKQFYLVRKSSQ